VSFARAGYDVRLWDPAPGAARSAKEYVKTLLPEMEEAGLLGTRSQAKVCELISAVSTLEEAVSGVCHVQENAPEDLQTKIQLFAELDALAPSDAIIASSTSALLPSAFTEKTPGRTRCIVAHPVNPPHLIPLVEIVPAPWTDEATIARTEALMLDVGQSPVVIQREIDGFLLNRLQAALLDEAFRLVDGGYAKAQDIDACMRDGLAMRWVFMGPFETIDLNAPGGVRDYVARYQGMFRRMTDTMRHSADWSGAVLNHVEESRRASLETDQLQARQIWRDRKLMAVAAFRRKELADLSK
jgi:3-hydroxyacyl-CoA dehydrogenase